jgi:ferrous iron transport protein B
MINKKILLVGNPNSGKSTLFNKLTGLNQKTSNFPGVTVEKKTGFFTIDQISYELIDLPGTYSLFPNSKDEKIVSNILCNQNNESYPDLIIYVADVNQLERHLLLASQISDLNIPLILVFNMIDLLEKEDKAIDTSHINNYFKTEVVLCDARSNRGVEDLKKAIIARSNSKSESSKNIYPLNTIELKTVSHIENYFSIDNSYQAKLIAHHHNWLDFLKPADKIQIKSFIGQEKFEDIKFQINETMHRFALLQPVVNKSIKSNQSQKQSFTERLDKIVTHRYIGPMLFFSLMFLIFQSIFSWAETPMTWIESGIAFLGQSVQNLLPDQWYRDLLVNGIIAGLGGVLVFIPQIFLLFFFLALLEESGYMSRVVYMFDNIMQKVGLNGRSMVALISSGACAIPAIMSTRTIGNWKERLITIMVSPLIPCSARIPVYTVLIALMIPSTTKFGIFNAQGMVFMALYILGIATSLVVAFLLKIMIKSEERSYLMIELPQYKKPLWTNIFLEIKQKVFSFIESAGKTIMIISVILWFLASFGPGDAMYQAENKLRGSNLELNDDQLNHRIKGAKLEASYAGLLGKFIEPAIKPLGFDWKIGIALITSFAAREVFVGTMATIYNVGEDGEMNTIRDRMAAELRPGSNEPLYNIPTSLSLLIFYAFAMQCMSTLAITKKETNSWTWTIIQFLLMTALAYLGSYLVYNLAPSYL